MRTASVKRSLVLLFLAACGPAGPTVLSPGVAETVFEHRVHATDLVRTHVVYPADDTGAPRAGARPAVVFIHGGLVPAERYVWWAEALAKEGFVVALPEHPLQLALFDVDRGSAARDLIIQRGLADPRRIAVAGHSLGGVVAAKLALQGGFSSLILEASLPDGPDAEPLGHLHIPSLSLAGRNDCSASLASVTEGWKALASPTTLAVLDGVTHYQFTDSDAEDQARGCAAGVPLADAHGRITAAVLAFLTGAPVPGSEVTTR